MSSPRPGLAGPCLSLSRGPSQGGAQESLRNPGPAVLLPLQGRPSEGAAGSGLRTLGEAWNCPRGSKSRPFPGTSVWESAPGPRAQQGRPSICRGWPWKLFRLCSCLSPWDKVTLPEGWADMASAKSQETGSPPNCLTNFLGDPVGQGTSITPSKGPGTQSLLCLKGRVCDMCC